MSNEIDLTLGRERINVCIKFRTKFEVQSFNPHQIALLKWKSNFLRMKHLGQNGTGNARQSYKGKPIG